MGNQNQRKLLPAGYDPVLNGWEIKEKNEECNVWRNPETGEEVDEYRRVFSDRRDYDFERATFEFRHSSSTLVASVYMKQETQNDVCSTFYKANVFLEHIPHRLSEFDHIPYPDILHIYHQAFRGFAELYDRVGYFQVEEDLICTNEHAQVKVWLNRDLSRATPQPIVTNCVPSEANMVRKIVNVIHSNTDLLTEPQNILHTMRRSNVSTFREANGVIEQIAARHRTLIPNQLDCILQIDSNSAREARRTVIAEVPQQRQVITTVTENEYAMPVNNVSARIDTPAFPIAPVITTTVATPAPVQLQPVRIQAAPAPVVKPFSTGFIPTLSNNISRMSYHQFANQRVAAAPPPRYYTVPNRPTKPLTAINPSSLSTIFSRPPTNRVIPTQQKSLSAIHYTSPVNVRPAQRVPIAPPLPSIAEKPTLQMRRTSGTVQKPAIRRAPSIKVQAKPSGSISKLSTSTFTPQKTANVQSAGLKTDLAATSSTGFFNKVAKTGGIQIPVKVSIGQVKNQVKEIPKPATREGNSKTILQETKYGELTSEDFYAKLGMSHQKDSLSTFVKSKETQPTPLATNTNNNFTSYGIDLIKNASISYASPISPVQTTTNPKASYADTYVPMSVSLTDTVTNSIVGNSYAQNKYQYESHTSAVGVTGLQLEHYASKTSNSYLGGTEKVQYEKISCEKEKESFSNYPAYTDNNYTTTLSSYTPPKVEFTYSSSQLPGSSYSRTIFQGNTSVTGQSVTYGTKGYQVTTETYKHEASISDLPSSLAGEPWNANSHIGTGLASYLPATSATSYDLSTSQTNYTSMETPLTTGYTSGLSSPSSRVAARLTNYSPSKVSPNRNTDNQELKYSSYSESISYSQSGYQSSNSQSFNLTNQASNVATAPSASYQPQSFGSYQPTTGGSYQAISSSPSSYQISSAGGYQTSYSVQMDSELLKDLQKLKKSGTLSPKKEKQEFNTGVSFGNNSGYIRDSLKNQAHI